MDTPYSLTPGKKFGSELLYTHEEKYLYSPVNKVKAGQRYKCVASGCSAGVTVSDGHIKRSRKDHINHGNHELKMREYASLNSLKEKCRTVEEIFSNQSIGTRAVYDKHLIQYVEINNNMYIDY